MCGLIWVAIWPLVEAAHWSPEPPPCPTPGCCCPLRKQTSKPGTCPYRPAEKHVHNSAFSNYGAGVALTTDGRLLIVGAPTAWDNNMDCQSGAVYLIDVDKVRPHALCVGGWCLVHVYVYVQHSLRAGAAGLTLAAVLSSSPSGWVCRWRTMVSRPRQSRRQQT